MLSLRNQLRGTIKEIVSDKVMSEVIVETAAGDVAAVITTRSVQTMKLQVGETVFVMVKAPDVSIQKVE
jgi:molybdopterin-binding protein